MPRTGLCNLTSRGTLATPRELAGAGREGQSVNATGYRRRHPEGGQGRLEPTPGTARAGAGLTGPRHPGPEKWTQVPFHESLHEFSLGARVKLARIGPDFNFFGQDDE